MNQLQNVLDNCENESEAAMPTAFCADWLTFKGGKTDGVQTPDDEIVSKLQQYQPTPIDTKVKIGEILRIVDYIGLGLFIYY